MSHGLRDGINVRFGNVHALIVDSGASSREPAIHDLHGILQSLGAIVTVRGPACEAAAELLPGRWDLVVIDLSMDDGPGTQAVRQAAALNPRPAILVVIGGHDARLDQSLCLLLPDRGELAGNVAGLAQAAMVRASQVVSSRRPTPEAPNSIVCDRFSSRFRLTVRERQVLNLLVAGSAPKEIANDLGVSEPTIRFHAVQIYKKCGVHNQRELLAMFARTTATQESPGIP